MSDAHNYRINPSHYGIKREVVTLHCIQCGKMKTLPIPHSTPDAKIMTYFKGWKAKGYKQQKETLCPLCQKIKEKFNE